MTPYSQTSRIGRRARAIAGLLTLMLAVSGCGFFNVDNPPEQFWGVWSGPYPDTISSVPETARWVFRSDGVYYFHALNGDGDVIFRENGYYDYDIITLTLMSPQSGYSEGFSYWFLSDDRLRINIRGTDYTYSRIGDQEAADNYTESTNETTAKLR